MSASRVAPEHGHAPSWWSATLVEKDQALHGKLAHLLAVSLALGGNLGLLLLGRPKRLLSDAA